MNTPPPPPPFGHAPGGWGHVPPAVKPSRRRAWLTHGAVAVVALGLGAGIGSAGKTGDSSAAAATPAVTVSTAAASAAPAPATTTATPSAPATTAARPTTTLPPTKPAAAKAASAPKVSGDGEYLVGQDMKAGTYKTAGPSDGLCYWERDKDSSGEFGSIIANSALSGTGRVTVKKGDVFKTQGCQDWTKVG